MDLKKRLRLLIPVFQSVFLGEEVSKLQDLLTKKSVLKTKQGKTQSKAPAITILISSIKDEYIDDFISVLETWNKFSLAEFSKKFIFGVMNEHVELLVKYWFHVVSCKVALAGLDGCIKGFSSRDAPTPNHWVEILLHLINSDSKGTKYFVLQVIKNVAHQEQQEQEDGALNGHECFSEVFKPIMKSKLGNEHVVVMGEDLMKKGIITQDAAKEIKNNKKKHKVFLDAISKNFTEECRMACYLSIERQGFSTFASVLNIYFQENNADLFWLLAHWPELIESQIVVAKLAAKHNFYTLDQLFGEEKKIETLDIILKATAEKTEKASSFLSGLKRLVYSSLVIDLSKVPLPAPPKMHKEALNRQKDHDELKFEKEIASKQAHTGHESTGSNRVEPTQKQSLKSSKSTGNGGETLTKHHLPSIGRGRSSSQQQSRNPPKENKTGPSKQPQGNPISIEKDPAANQVHEETNSNGHNASNKSHGYNLRNKDKFIEAAKHSEGGSGNGQFHHSDEAMSVGCSLSSFDDDENRSRNRESHSLWSKHVEFCLLVDKKCELPVAEEGQVLVYLDHVSKRLPLKYDPERKIFFGSTEINVALTTLVYKYVWVDEKHADQWEKLPEAWSKIVNRKFTLQKVGDNVTAACMTLFDVATFKQDAISFASDIASMYARNVLRHLPKINMLNFGNENNFSNFDFVLNELENWYYCAKCGVKYTTYYRSSDMFPSCIAELGNYIEQNAKYGIGKDGTDQVAVCQRILVYLAILVVLYRNKVEIQKRNFDKFCLALSPSGVEENDLKLLHSELKSCERDMTEETCEAVLYLNQQMKHPLLFLQLLPLYYVLKNDGSCACTKEVWTDIVNVFIQKKEFESCTIKDATESVPYILELSKLFPPLLDLFQSRLPTTLILHMINSKDDVTYLKQSSFLIALLSGNDVAKVQHYFGSENLLKWLSQYLQEVEERCRSEKLPLDDVVAIGTINQHMLNFLRAKIGDLRRLQSSDAFRFLKIALKLLGLLSYMQEMDNSLRLIFQEASQILFKEIKANIDSDSNTFVTEVQVEKWNFLLTPSFKHADWNAEWQAGISKVIQEKLSKQLARDNSNVLDVFEKELDGWKACAEVQSCVAEAVFEYAMNLKYEERNRFMNYFSLTWETGQFKKMAKLFEKMFIKSFAKWKALSPKDPLAAVLNFALQWPFFVRYFKFFDNAVKKKSLKPEVQNQMEFILEQLQIVQSLLQSGKILFEYIDLICSFKTHFEEVLALLHEDFETSLELLIRRSEESQAYFDMTKNLKYCFDLCQTCDINLDKLRASLKTPPRLQPLCDVVERTEGGSIKVKFYDIDEETTKALEEIQKCGIADNELTRMIWSDACKKVIEVAKDCDDDNPEMEMNDVASTWRSVKYQIISLRKQILSGSLILADVEKFFGKFRESKSFRTELHNILKGICDFPSKGVEYDVEPQAAETSDEEYDTADDSGTDDAPDDSMDNASSSTSHEAIEFLQQEESADEPYCIVKAPTVAQLVVFDDDADDANDSQSGGGSVSEDVQEEDLYRNVNDTDAPEACESGDVVMVDEAQVITDRIEQIFYFFTMQHNQDVAVVFHELKECLELQGDFSFLEIVLKQSDIPETQPLKCITSVVVKASQRIKDIQLNSVQCLKDFLLHPELIQWLRKNMNRKEVKVMSDLAMISAGENTMEVDKVSCFLSAVMGFAPFLFDLDEKNADLNALIEAFEKIPKGKSEQVKLKEKWNKTAQYLDWLKQIKDFHGSVEKSSLARAQDINSKGVYVIGGEKEKIPADENALRLELSSDQTVSTLSELHNLKSRLMLMAGKGLDDVKVFTEVLNLVENLTKVYVKLKAAGCLLFSNWTARICCRSGSTSSDEDSGELGSMEVSFDNHSPSIRCQENVCEELKKLTAVMEEVNKRWKQSLNEKRNQFYHLNHFNIQQIMYLCQELAAVASSQQVPDQVCTLLEFVKPNVRGNEIFELLKEATKIKNDDEEQSEESKEDEEVEISQVEHKRRMVRLLVEECIPEKLAKAAVQSCDFPLNKDDCIIKALELEATEYEADDETIALVKEFDREAGFSSSTTEVKVIQSVVNDRSALTLQKVITEIMSKPIDDIDTNMASVTVKTVCERYLVATAVTSLSDCISIEHLGILLDKLSDKNAKRYPQRKFPLEEGRPNLVVCPENDMFSTLLSLYMHSLEEPLPTLSEVLLCSENTTMEEVDLFLRRAICFDSRLGTCIFCLAFADKLSYDVANTSNSLMKQLESEIGPDQKYKLVVLSSASQHSDYISSFLSENRVDYQHRFTPEDVQKYLSKHMNLHESHLLTLPVAKHFDINTSVLIVTSQRAGMGKSLHIERWRERKVAGCRSVIVRLLEKQVNEDEIMQRLLPQSSDVRNASSHFIHFDITPSVQHGFSPFFFNLMILGGFKDGYGTLWRRQPQHVYFIEYTTKPDANVAYQPKLVLDQNLFSMLPLVRCLSPREVLEQEKFVGDGQNKHVLKMDQHQFESDLFQRPFQYLQRYSNNQNLDSFTFAVPEGSPAQCIGALLKECSVKDPTWSELRHFASFLNNQLRDCEQSVFCSMALVGGDSGLSGFKNFVVRFMIRMSQDFATPSLVSESDASSTDGVFNLHQLRRRWEEGVHPYLFFNEDHVSMTFLNFVVDANGNLLNPKNSLNILHGGLLNKQLLEGLKIQRVSLNQDFDKLSRTDKLTTLYRVMGLEEVSHDPDPSYELTTDNVLKLLAIHMRLRCSIPVVVMGETGCGKTRMVEFISKLKAVKKLRADGGNQSSDESKIRNMVIVKVHGGITVPIIQRKMREAVELAKRNKMQYDVDTLLFLDEANTTEAIYAIKEFVCDRTIDGEPMDGSGLQIVCACNPYRKHSEEAIKNMADAGLGFRVKTEDTTDKLGDIPMRCLVYRVIALPPSMQPLVWDFGQLSEDAERIYIQQMVAKLPIVGKVRRMIFNPNDPNLIVAVLSASQSYMRKERSQCLFVSLRDVERCLQCFQWFYQNSDWLYNMIDEVRFDDFPNFPMFSGIVLRTLIHSIGMCYHVTLEKRDSYRLCICRKLAELFGCNLQPKHIVDEITACQVVFSKSLNLEDNIARNEALMENTFMLSMCIEMRIPLFLVGKPGSSKSLAKTVVTDAMQGGSSESKVYRKLKQVHVLSFQCSAVSDAVGIAAVFNQCEKVQANQNLEKFVSVVVLDEVGLAEDSPKMPLKVLHPLLEGSSADLEKSENEKMTLERSERNPLVSQRRVGFVGISNWALDPAKMNRGVFVIRGDPSKNDLELTAKGIFSSDSQNFKKIDKLVELLTESYMEIRESQKNQNQEFFGLRDYYGLLKMIFAVVKQEDVELDYYHVSDAIKRNFSGGKIDCFEIFLKKLQQIWPDAEKSKVSVKRMIKNNLASVNECESRFLLLLTNRFAAINLINDVVKGTNFQIIFGSSFPGDGDYIELCRNINKIKICMESGCTVVLLNLRDLYESLYDALNQHYVTFADQRYVDLGLGGHRVKCRVAREFRLIVIEDKNVVYDEFPIPLINRLEKYVFTSESILDEDNVEVVKRLQSWTKRFAEIDIPVYKRLVMKQFSDGQCFPGYNGDSAASAVLNALVSNDDSHQSAQLSLLNTATVDSVYRLHKSKLKKEAEKLRKAYFIDQSHDNLVSFFQRLVCQSQTTPSSFSLPSFMFEITSFSKILGEPDRIKMEKALELPSNSVMLLTLQQFQTLNEYNAKVKSFFNFSLEDHDGATPVSILLIQCPQAHKHSNLIACARFSVKNMVQEEFLFKLEISQTKVFVAFLYTMDRVSSPVESKSSFSFHSSDFTPVFLDELRPSVDYMGPPSKVFNKTVSEVFESSMRNYNPAMAKLPCKFANEDFIFDPIKLIRDSVSGALVKVKSRSNEKGRNRVQLLQPLFQDKHPLAVPFQNILLKRIADMLKLRDEMIDPLAWSVDEACSQQSLHEGGTFAKTLWLRLKAITTSVLAKIVSVLDEDNNFDLLCQEHFNAAFIEFWLQVFQSDEDLCKFSLTEVLRNSKEIDVRGTKGFSCQFPFSRRITECFTRLWNFSQDFPFERRQEVFFTKVDELQITNIINDVFSSKQMLILEDYIHDLIRLLCKFSPVDKAEFPLFACSLKAMVMFSCKNKPSTNFLAVAYSLLMSNHTQLQQMHAVLEIHPQLLDGATSIDEWMVEQKSNKDFLVHAIVYQEMLQHVEKQFDNFTQPKHYHKWKEFVRKILSLKVDLSSLNRSGDRFIKIKSMHKALAFVDLFLSVLMPDGLSEEEFEHYLSVLAPLSIRLWKGATISFKNEIKKSVTDAKFLKIVMKILQTCSKDLFLKLLLSWKEISCRSCCKPKVADPVVLPCDCLFCYKCIQLAAISRQCSYCRKDFPEGYQMEVAKLSPEKKEEFDDFKQNCSSFFVQYLSTLCIPARDDGTTVSDDVWVCLQGLVVGESETREMTPIDMESFDETPTVRSFILQLLLRYNRENTKGLLENHFQKMEKVLGDKKQLMIIYIRCVEDLHQIRANQSKSSSPQAYQEYISNLIQQTHKDFKCIDAKSFMEETESSEKEDETDELNLLQLDGTSKAKGSQVTVLDVVAATRYLMKTAAKLVVKFYSEKEECEAARLCLRSVCGLLERIDLPMAKAYFVKILCRRFGFSYYQEFLEHESDFHALIPAEVNPSVAEMSPRKSSLFVLGSVFRTTQTRLMSVESEKDLEKCIDNLSCKASQSNDVAVQVFHAIHFWLKSVRSEESKNLRSMFCREFLKKTRTNQNISIDLLNFFTGLFEENRTLPETSAHMSRILQEFVEVAASTISSASDPLLKDLKITSHPYRIATLFLPTMPESVFFDPQVQDVIKKMKEGSSRPPKPYLCPEGHVYFIGNCTNPEGKGTCPDCHKAIGASSGSTLAPGNVAGTLTMSTQAGYLLGNPGDRPVAVTPERNRSKLDVCTIRMFLHASLLHFSKNKDVMSLLKQPDEESAREFLVKHLQIDFQQFLGCLGKSAEDGALLLHQIMKTMRSQTSPRPYGCSLNSMLERRVWEDEFHRRFLSEAFENCEDLIEEARKECWSNQKQNDLERLVYEIPEASEGVNDESSDSVSVNSPYLWNYEINVTISHLRQKLEGITSHDQREGKLLKLLLNEVDLDFVQFLPSILMLQNCLIQRYQNKVDVNDVERITLAAYCEEEDRAVSDAQLQTYIRVWNAVNENLPHPNRYDVTKDDLAYEMNMDSPVSMCLPSLAGRGRYALLMVEYLLDKQNNLLLGCKELLPNAVFNEISTDQLNTDDLICIDNEQALMPLVLSNSQYQVTVGDTGSKHSIVYRFAALEKQVAEKFIINKKMLSVQSLPQISYLQDTGLGRVCELMRTNVTQAPLPLKILQKFEEKITQSRLPDICEGVRTLALVISHLAKLESDPEKPLQHYVTSELLLPVEEAYMIPKSAKLSHVMALYERLSCQRSRLFVLSGEDPFVNATQQDGGNELAVTPDEIRASLKSVDHPQLQLELNSMILLKSGLEPSSSLRENLAEYVRSKYNDEERKDVKWCESLLKELRVEDAPRVFRFSVQLNFS